MIGRFRQPLLGKLPIPAHVVEAQHRIAVDLHSRPLVAQVSALAPPREQAIRRIGQEQLRALADEQPAVQVRVAGVAADGLRPW